MSALQGFVETRLATALAWTIVHSLWECSAVALVLMIALGTIRDARSRYLTALAALLTAFLAFAATLAIQMWPTGHGAVASALSLPPRPAAEAGSLAASPNPLDSLGPWIALFWILGAVGYYLFHTASWLATRRILGRGICRPEAVWVDRLEALRALIGISSPVRLLESALSRVPIVIGWWRPVILLPVGMLASMPVGQVEAILLHELAHIARRDYVANLFQTLAEGLLYHHPAVWWISSVIRQERENCCDDAVIAAGGDRLEYATALAALEQSRWPASTVPAATGGLLMQRISRLLYPNSARRVPSMIPAAALALAIAFAVLAWPAPQQAPPKGATATQDSPWLKWINEDVAYIVRADERAAFLGLGSGEEREKFIEQFWLRRDPTPGTAVNEMKDEHYRRIASANQRFRTGSGIAGWKTDPGRIYIAYGPPDEIEAHGATPAKPANQLWRYKFIKGVGSDVLIEFVDTKGTGDFTMTTDPSAPLPRSGNGTVMKP